MLRPASPTGYTCACARCASVLTLDSTTLEQASAEARSRGWMDQARAGAGMARWPWLCTKCRPQAAATTSGLSTGHMKKPGD